MSIRLGLRIGACCIGSRSEANAAPANAVQVEEVECFERKVRD